MVPVLSILVIAGIAFGGYLLYVRRNKIDVMRRLTAYIEEDAAQLNTILANPDEDERRIRLSELLPTYLSPADCVRRAAELKRLTVAYADELLRTVRESYDSASMLKLIELVKEVIYTDDVRVPTLSEEMRLVMFSNVIPNSPSKKASKKNGWRSYYSRINCYQWCTDSAYVFPEDWNDLVANSLENPSLKQFNLPRSTWNTGIYRLKAAEALETQSLTLAKVVLAYANDYSKVRAELGTLAEYLALMISALQNGKNEFHIKFEKPVE